MYAIKEKSEDIVKTLFALDFTNSQVRRLLSNYKKTIGSLEDLEVNYIYYRDKMISLGYSEYQIHELASRYPKVIKFRFSSGKLFERYAEYVKTIPEMKEIEEDENNFFEFNKIIQILSDLGVSEQRINFIFSKNIDMIFMDPERIKDNIKFYHSVGLTDSDLVNLLNHHAKILEYGEEDYRETIASLPLFSLSKNDLGRIIINISRVRRMFINDDFKRFTEWALTKPLDYESVGKRIVKTSSIILTPTKCLDDGFQNIMNLGFSEEDAGYILSHALSTITMSYENLLFKLKVPTFVGVSEEDAKSIVLKFPEYLTQGGETLKEKFEIYSKRGLLKFIINRPKNIIQNAELTDARADYLRRFYPWIVEPAYSRMVFTSEGVFQKRFNGNNTYVKKLLENKKGK